MSIDARLREALNHAIDEPSVNADAVTTRVMERLGEAGGGALVGLGLAAFGDDGAASGEVLQAVAVYACPGEGEAGLLYQGDRVYVVGQAAGHLAVRDLRGNGDVVFVAAQYVTPDANTADLPVMACQTNIEPGPLTPTASPR